jgi:phage recombination protein Bet
MEKNVKAEQIAQDKPTETPTSKTESPENTVPQPGPKQELQQQTNDKIVKYEKIAHQTGIDAETVAVIHNSVAKNTSIAELAYFLNVAKGLGLNPFNKEIWCYRDNKGNLLVFTGRDGFLRKAQEHPRYNGFRSAAVRENDGFQMITTNDELIIKHEIKPSKAGRGALLGAYCISYLKDGKESAVWVDFSMYNKGKFTWETHPDDMIMKVAESHGLKKAFGITGLQSEYDFQIGADNIARPVENTQVTILND